MLSNYAASEALALAVYLANNNRSVSVIANPNPVEALCKANTTAALVIGINDEVAAYNASMLEASRFRSTDGAVDHDLVTEELVSVMTKTVAGNLDLAKNLVVPVIKGVITAVDDSVQTNAMSSINNLAVVPKFLSSIWNSPILQNMVEVHADTAVQDQNLFSVSSNLTSDEVKNLLTTGAGPLDEDIQALLDDVSPEYPAAIFNEVFARTSEFGRTLSQVLNPYLMDNKNDIVLVYILARRLLDDLPNNVTINLDSYRVYMSTIMAQAGVSCLQVLKQREEDYKFNNLVTYPFNPGSSALITNQIVIFTNGPVYNKWLNEGGRPEILMGAFLTDRENDYSKLLASAEDYCKAYERYQLMRSSVIADKKFTFTVSGLRQAMLAKIHELPDDVVPSKNALVDVLNYELAEIKAPDLDNFYKLVTHVVCKVLYAHTDAERILTAMDTISKQYPTISPEEAALLATIDLVTHWVSQQLVIK